MPACTAAVWAVWRSTGVRALCWRVIVTTERPDDQTPCLPAGAVNAHGLNVVALVVGFCSCNQVIRTTPPIHSCTFFTFCDQVGGRFSTEYNGIRFGDAYKMGKKKKTIGQVGIVAYVPRRETTRSANIPARQHY